MAATLETRNIGRVGQDAAVENSSLSTSLHQTPLDGRGRSQPLQTLVEQSQRTPPRVTFAESSNKRALPVSPLGSSFPGSQGSVHDDRASSGPADSQSGKSGQGDVDMDSDGGGDDGSDNESLDGESGRPSKKKKGQRFFCTDYPPCNLSFTRSEHLARHIRKHTGERPFQCHCARRFSRLDNLRQHAQTVHVNEDIPAESLAATGTRFQRQIRTDRVRPPGRSRASTGGSTGSRGHGRNLSTSSITSTGSTMSTISNLSTLSRDTSVRRPQPLMMAENSPRSHLTIDTMKAAPHGGYGYGGQSPGDAVTTPTSVAFSNTPSSPFNPTLGSPMGSNRPAPSWGDRTPGRRLSVPSSANPFQPTSPGFQSPNYPLSHPHHGHSRNSSTSSIVASPTSSVYSFARNDAASEAEWRRRTWHPSTYSNYGYQQRPATSGLMYHQTPDAPRPAFAQQPAAATNSQSQRLPGIETFDQISQRPLTPPRSAAAPQTQPETPSRQATYPTGEQRSMHTRGHASWDMSLHQNLTKLDIANGSSPREAGSWGRQVLSDIQNVSSSSNASQPHNVQPTSAPVQVSAPVHTHAPPANPLPSSEARTQVTSHQPLSDVSTAPSAPQQQNGQHKQQQSTLPERSRRQGWYYGQFGAALRSVEKRTSSEDTSSSDSVRTPLTAAVDYPPSIIHASGYIESRSAAGPGYPNFTSPHHPHPFDAASTPIPKSHAMSGLEALVAVATSENKARDAMQCS